jgi:hypothetical protein
MRIIGILLFTAFAKMCGTAWTTRLETENIHGSIGKKLKRVPICTVPVSDL